MAFCVDGCWNPVAVRVHEETGAVRGTVHGDDTLAPAAIAAAVEQVERILSLDIDGRGFPDVARHDPVVAQLQSRYPGLRPVCFWSPYEAAAWSVIGQRIRIVQAAAIKARITAEHGETIDVGGRMVRAFPNPAKLAQLSTINGLSETKLQRLRGIAEAALEGTLGAARLRSLPRSQALEELIAIPGIGPFSAELILLRGAGDPDFTPTAEPRLARAVAIAYDMKAPPSAADIAEISEVWKPYRTSGRAPPPRHARRRDPRNCRTSHHQNARTVIPCGPDRMAGLKSSLLPRCPTSHHRSRSTLPAARPAARQRRRGAPWSGVTLFLAKLGVPRLLPLALLPHVLSCVRDLAEATSGRGNRSEIRRIRGGCRSFWLRRPWRGSATPALRWIGPLRGP